MFSADLMPGDVFCVTSEHWLSKSIRAVSKVWSTDNQCEYSHAGIILDQEGLTIEALNDGIRKQNLFTAYKGKPVIIARPDVTMLIKNTAMKSIIIEHLGRIYPYWRLVYHILGPVAKFGSTKYLVCSELVAKYLWLCRIEDPQYRGKTPDILSDRFHHWKEYTIIYEGVL